MIKQLSHLCCHINSKVLIEQAIPVVWVFYTFSLSQRSHRTSFLMGIWDFSLFVWCPIIYTSWSHPISVFFMVFLPFFYCSLPLECWLLIFLSLFIFNYLWLWCIILEKKHMLELVRLRCGVLKTKTRSVM